MPFCRGQVKKLLVFPAAADGADEVGGGVEVIQRSLDAAVLGAEEAALGIEQVGISMAPLLSLMRVSSYAVRACWAAVF